MMPSIASLVMIILILDTGQGQESCRDGIPDGCSCLKPNHLRCTGKNGDLDNILEQIKDKNITALDLTLTNLNILQTEVFNRVQTLSALVISASQLQSVSKNALRPLRRNLTALGLPNNLLKSIPDEIFDLPNLNRLDLSQNQIEMFDSDKLKQSLSLEYLNLSENIITGINHVEVPVSMDRLVLKKNQLTLSTILKFNFVRLKTLDISYNNLNGTLSKTNFQPSNTLRKLDMSFNELVNLNNECFINFPRLKNLNLKSNDIEVIKQRAFQGLQRLRELDLSSNSIVELPLNVFNGLKGLEHLDLSFNHLQVVSADLMSGLFNLDTLKLGSNDIIRIDPLKDCKHLSTLSLDSNPLECSCQMRSFQAWVQETIQLSLSSKRSIRCSTPTKLSNAILNNLDELSCDDHESNEDIIPLQLSIPEEFSLLSKSISNDELSLKWQVKLSNFTSDQAQLYRDDGKGDKISLISKPLIPLPQNDEEDNQTITVLEASFDLKKVGILTQPYTSSSIHPDSLSACATILNVDNIPLTNCTRIQLNSEAVVKGNRDFGPLASLTSIHAITVIQGVIEVNFDIKNQSESDADLECKINLVVEAGDEDDIGERVVATHIIKCEAKNFTFNSVRLASNQDRLRVCAFLDFGPTLNYHTNSICSNVISNQIAVAEPATLQPRRPLHHSQPILPLVLTLVFLGVGIATLVVLYLIVKGYLSDRHKADLFRMRFCYSFSRTSNGLQHNPPRRPPEHGGGLDASAISKPPGLIMRWTHRFFMWKRRRHHHSVPASDELSLREESTFDTSVV